ncbi:YjbQ family protein [Sulfurimonas sp. MAG313]|nr:secondary thiamine-phosphate synthase enzyme YjbQ [Sulfurimonas sp. MAG313]MDF1879752.1 YjbQ family protein [Sulfurimonas sp. MAG313]
MTKFQIKTEHTTQMINITEEVKEAVITSGVKDGIVVVFTPHTTASVVLFENVDQNLRRDYLALLKDYVSGREFAHKGGNAQGHLKSALTGASVSIPVVDGHPMFGEWQGLFFCEFDGPRDQRDIIIKVING